jgi:hypothetical protein
MTAHGNGFIKERSPGAFTMRERAFAEARIRRVQDDVRQKVVVVGERRIARIAGGAVGILGAALLVTTLLTSGDGALCEPAWALALAVLAAVLAYGASRAVLRIARPSRTRQALMSSTLGRLESWSIGLPLVALALLAPLTIHAAVWAIAAFAFGDTPLATATAELSGWIGWSAIIVGNAHLALAAWVVRFAKTLTRSTTEQVVALHAANRGWRHLVFTTAVAAVPGVLLVLPPVIVFATGALFLPLAYHLTRAVILAERSAIEERDARWTDATIEIEDLENAREALAAGHASVATHPAFLRA